MFRHNKPKYLRLRNRKGAAVVELAFALPLLLLIVFGSIESCNAIYLQQLATEIAYQGALEGIKVDSTEQSVKDRMQDFVDETSIVDATFVVEGINSEDFNTLTKGDTFRVEVIIPTATNLLSVQIVSGTTNISAFRVANKQ